jgi:hypothetical protein
VFSVVGRGGHTPDELALVAPEIARVLLRAWRADAAERYPSCGAMATELRMVLARHHPMMARPSLRQFLQETLPDLIESHRAGLRALPSGAVDEVTTEPTQSFTAQALAGAPPGTAGPATRAEPTQLVRSVAPASSSARRRRWAMAAAAAGVALASAAAWRLTSSPPARELTPTTNAAAVAIAPAQDAGAAAVGATSAAGAADDDASATTSGTDRAASSASADANVAPPMADAGAAPARHSRRRVAAPERARAMPAVAVVPQTPPATGTGEAQRTASAATTPAREPGSIQSKREMVRACGVCDPIRRQIDAGKHVDEVVPDNCVRQCRGAR